MSALFSLQPTFTQGLILGQVSVLCLLLVVLRYLFLDTDPALPYLRSPLVDEKENARHLKLPTASHDADIVGGAKEPESAEWLNLILYQVRVRAYCFSELLHLGSPDCPGVPGRLARPCQRRCWRRGCASKDRAVAERGRVVELHGAQRASRDRHAHNACRAVQDPIRVHAVDLGSGCPHVSDVHFEHGESLSDVVRAISTDVRGTDGLLQKIKLRLSYTDTVSVSISTSILFNYPAPYFARLPVSLSISLSLFSSLVSALTLPLPS